ncbi:MAG TPA: hypothetical protein VFZ69_11085 [Longimicrobiales bacterium]
MKSKLLVMTMATLLAAPAALMAQSAEANATAQARAQTPQSRIDAALETALSAGIPQTLIESKVAEGKAKGVAPERIAAAVEARLAGLLRAADALTRANVQAQSAGELAVTADALEAGVSESAVVSISRDAPAERRAVAVAVLADLVRLGHANDKAFARVNAALSSSASLANLHAEVASQLRLGGMRSTLDAAGIVRVR